jgi:ABC-type multidrug transport system ATPase subunit
MTTQVLEADSMWLEYSGIKILQNIYIKVQTGQVVGLLGRNGTGKSSLLRMIFGTLRGQNQSVRVDKQYMEYPYQQKGLLRYLPQHHFIPPHLPVRQVCDLYEVSFEEVCLYFPKLKVSEREKIGNLSGGGARLIETLLILLSPVSFILLDEPFTHLAPVTVDLLKEVIREQKKQKGIVVSDHAYSHVLDLSDEMYLIVPVGRSILLKDAREELTLYGYTA